MSETPKTGAPSAPEPYVLTPADLWALTTYDFHVTNGPGGRPCVFKLRRMDMMTQLLEDVINAPLMTASMAIIKEVQEWIAAEGGSFESAFEHLGAAKKRTVLEHLRHFACKVVLAPKLTADPVGEPDAFPVALMGADTLFAIWNHTPPQATVPRLSEVAAADFREGAGANADRAASDGAGVRTRPLDLAAHAGAAGQP